ncbi:MAG TPA: FemAB family XrtA/PEP-CTERM system-associated protein [Planctomycetota bacterium]|jgi:FemAB-related protein (PEP-CTERM system-associated)|nr:FemAB family XrtA/PEP-CTERM system-associated protein [Planctomycetota bacterium]
MSAPAPAQVQARGGAGGELRVRPAEPGDEAQWRALVTEHAGGSPFHLPAWARCVEETFRHEPRHLLVERGGRPAGVLPLFHVRSPFLGRNLISVPYAVYGGPIAVDREAEAALLAAAGALARRLRVGYLELRWRDDPGNDLPENDLYVTFRRELPPPGSDTLSLLPRKARAATRQARERFGLEFVEGLWYLPDLARLFAINKRHLGSPGLPREHFERLREGFAGGLHLHVVRRGSEPIAAVLSLAFRDTIFPYYSGAVTEVAERSHANNLLYWGLLDWASARGYRWFDFGRSRRGTGAADFKKNQGFEASPLHYRYVLVRRRRVPTFTPSNPSLDLPRRLWRTLPLRVTELLSRRLSRYLP